MDKFKQVQKSATNNSGSSGKKGQGRKGRGREKANAGKKDE